MRLVMPCAVQAQAVTRTQKGEVDSCHLFGGLAQLGERLLCKQNVIGSIPVTSTIYVNAGLLTERYQGVISFRGKVQLLD
jgi:hypothetical protein